MARLGTDSMVAAAKGKDKGAMMVEDGKTPRLQFDIHTMGTRFDALSRHPRLAGLMQELMGMPLYILHSKLAFKAPFTGSVQYWHQDFGYWVTDGNPRPDMASCLVMLDEHTEDNACLQVLAGSHRDGVVAHEEVTAELTGNKQLRISAADMTHYCSRYPRVKLVGKPGTFAAWHCNTMHGSAHNISDKSRNAAIFAFNAVGNHGTKKGPLATSPSGLAEAGAVVLSADDSLLQ
jgi:ectoine hydroxylase-related dioxygenase (phytanoyl-CoA dioxygenase family)